MNKIVALAIMAILGTSCSNEGAIQNELNETKQQLAAAQVTIEQLKAAIEPEGDLIHLVFFNLKPEVDPEVLVKEIKKLEAIEEVMDLEVGAFAELGDARAMSEYQLLMQMSFADSAAYQSYQKHPIHMALKEIAMPWLNGPPVTYDLYKK